MTAEKAGGRGHYGEGCRDLHLTAKDWVLQSHSQVSGELPEVRLGPRLPGALGHRSGQGNRLISTLAHQERRPPPKTKPDKAVE